MPDWAIFVGPYRCMPWEMHLLGKPADKVVLKCTFYGLCGLNATSFMVVSVIDSFLIEMCTQDTAGQKFKDLVVCFPIFALKEVKNKNL